MASSPFSLRTKLLIAIPGMVMLTTISMMLVVAGKTENYVSALQNRHARHLVTTTALAVLNLLETAQHQTENSRSDIDQPPQMSVSGQTAESYQQAILANVAAMLSNVRVGTSGYMYLFNGNKEMLIHPTLAGADFSHLLNPVTNNPILDDLEQAAHTPEGVLDYIWDKPPGHKGEFRFWKRSHLIYIKPLDWYIASTVYTDDIEAPGREISRYILIVCLIALLFSVALSLLLVQMLTRPLQRLTEAAQHIDHANLTDASVPVTGSLETQRLGRFLNEMLDSIRQAMAIKEELFEKQLKLESELNKAEKLRSVGRLASGIAHEINTPTQYVKSNVDFLHEAMLDLVELINQLRSRIGTTEGAESEQLHSELEAALDAADWDYLQEEIPKALEQSDEGLRRVGQLVGAMKRFAHPGSSERQAVDLNEGIRNTVIVASNEWKYVAELQLDLEHGLPEIPGYADELNQVILNMVVNSAHAILEKNRGESTQMGRITIRTRQVDHSVEVTLSDTGIGIRPEELANIFDPFYTTKEVGHGTGQGLAIAHDIITNKHNGTITVHSTPDEGTTFIITLPLHNDHEENG